MYEFDTNDNDIPDVYAWDSTGDHIADVVGFDPNENRYCEVVSGPSGVTVDYDENTVVDFHERPEGTVTEIYPSISELPPGPATDALTRSVGDMAWSWGDQDSDGDLNGVDRRPDDGTRS